MIQPIDVKVWVDIGKREYFDGLTYVALSRVRNLKDMIIQQYPFERKGNISKSKALSFRKAEENRLHTQNLVACRVLTLKKTSRLAIAIANQIYSFRIDPISK